ncbi:MAG: hypothetical protein ACE5E7_09320 [Anaerolineae bacterium]
MKKIKRSDYQAFLLRLWRDDEQQPWRASLEDPHTGEQCGFANLEQLFAYLKEQTASGTGGLNEQIQDQSTNRKQ